MASRLQAHIYVYAAEAEEYLPIDRWHSGRECQRPSVPEAVALAGMKDLCTSSGKDSTVKTYTTQLGKVAIARVLSLLYV